MIDRRVTIQTIAQLVLVAVAAGVLALSIVHARADRADTTAVIRELRDSRQARYEYKVLAVATAGDDRQGDAALKPASVTPSETELTRLGSTGWEVVSSYLEIETAYPNFGDSKYVTGLQPNIRPQRAVLILRRRVA